VLSKQRRNKKAAANETDGKLDGLELFKKKSRCPRPLAQCQRVG